MIKYYCDKCGKEIKDENPLTMTIHKKIIILGDIIETNWQLCSECGMELTNNFVNPLAKNIIK